MNAKLCIVFYTFFVMADYADPSRQNGGHSKKESHLKSARNPRSRGDTFESLVIIYDPTFLSLVWPKITNGVHVNIERNCWNDLRVFFDALAEGRVWAYNVVDASGRYHSGLFGGNRLWLGSKELCLRLDRDFVRENADYYNAVFRGDNNFGDDVQWRSAFEAVRHRGDIASVSLAEVVPSHRLGYSVVQLQLNITKFSTPKHYDVSLGVCLPRSCSTEDVASIVQFSIMLNDNLKINTTIPRTVKVSSIRQVGDFYDLSSDTGALCLIIITVIIIILVIAATVIDLRLVKWNSQASKIAHDLHKYNFAEKRFIDESRKRFETNTIVKDPKSHERDKFETKKDIARNLNKVSNKIENITPSFTLDVMSQERIIASCLRCGKYRKQCGIPKQFEILPACPRMKYNSSICVNIENSGRDTLFVNLLLSFSLKHNWIRIFNTTMSNKDLAVMHIMKIGATFWVVYFHVAMILEYLSENGGEEMAQKNAYRALTTGTLAFDTLLFASGMFSAHHFFFLSSRYTLRELVSYEGRCGQWLQFLCFVSNRAIRLLPPYIYVIFMSRLASRVWRNTLAPTLPEGDHDNCNTYWWRNILYLTVFYPRSEQCMQVSWYLTSECALHALGALLCVCLNTQRRRLTVLFTNAVVLTATSYEVIRGLTDKGQHFSDVFEMYSVVIERPIARVVPYLVGVLCGWLVHRLEGKTNVSESTRYALFLASLGSLAAMLVVSQLRPGWMTGWLHLCWPIGLLWPSLVCATDHAGATRSLVESGVVVALSRLAYCTLLLHGIMARSLLLGAGGTLYYDNSCVWSFFAGTATLSVLGALVLSLLIEMPFCCLLRRITDYVYS